mmetsp:Transcript_14957/g.34810  ORF Transcript_14957/g.34810 Transcript_14957/m.34810 type:complete len:254 (-) Transcript_14957:66-827(-)
MLVGSARSAAKICSHLLPGWHHPSSEGKYFPSSARRTSFTLLVSPLTRIDFLWRATVSVAPALAAAPSSKAAAFSAASSAARRSSGEVSSAPPSSPTAMPRASRSTRSCATVAPPVNIHAVSRESQRPPMALSCALARIVSPVTITPLLPQSESRSFTPVATLPAACRATGAVCAGGGASATAPTMGIPTTAPGAAGNPSSCTFLAANSSSVRRPSSTRAFSSRSCLMSSGSSAIGASSRPLGGAPFARSATP